MRFMISEETCFGSRDFWRRLWVWFLLKRIFFLVGFERNLGLVFFKRVVFSSDSLKFAGKKALHGVSSPWRVFVVEGLFFFLSGA